jgi:release factor glutamine methyltransferase
MRPHYTDTSTRIIDAIIEAEDRLRLAQITDTPRLEAEVLLADTLDIERTKLIASYPDQLDTSSRAEYLSKIDRRSRGEPVAYLTGTKEFMGLVFEVNSRALIPRPETEVLVEHIIAMVEEREIAGARILDIGTGCGCIATSLAHYMHDASIVATDISPDAIRLAKQNAALHRVNHRITFCEGSVFSAVPQSLKGTFDIIVSNPPYIPESEYPKLEKSVRDYEPPIALKGGVDGLDIIRSIAADAAEYLGRDGVLALEIGENQSTTAAEILKSTHHLTVMDIIHDLGNRPRVIISWKSERKR